MTDAAQPSAAERLAALRKPTEKRGKPALTAKVLVAGVSTTAMFALVAAMGWPSDTTSASGTAAVGPTELPTVAPATVPTVAPPVQAVPAPAVPVPVVIPPAVPAPAPAATTAAPVVSNAITETSG